MEEIQHRHCSGVTLFELMIVLAIVSVLVTIVAPNVSSIVAKHRMIAELNDLSGAIRFARFNAVDQQLSTALCPSHNFSNCDFNNWNLPKIVFTDLNHNNLRDADEALLHSTSMVHNTIKMKGPKKSIRFYGDGVVSSPATVTFCPKQKRPKLNRALVVSLQGRIRTSKDTNNDEIHEVRKGKPVECL